MWNVLSRAGASLWGKLNSIPGSPPKPPAAPILATVIAPPDPFGNALAGLPLDYLIGTDGPQQGKPKRITEPSLGTVPAANGLSIAYINLRREDGEPAKYGPYLEHDDIWKQYAEGRPDPKSAGYKRNIVEQLDRAVAQGHYYVELDNPDSYPLDAVMQALAWVEERKLRAVAKNPLLLNDGAVQYLAHPAIVGAIVEDNCGTPEEMEALRRKAAKPDLPIWFVSFGTDQRARVMLTAKGAARYPNMGVTYSSAGEYGNSVDILLPDSGAVAEPPAQPSVPVSSSSNEAKKTDMPPASVAQKPTQIIPAIIPGNTAHFEACVKLVLVHEGGNDDDPNDPGGRTSRGIIQTEWNAWRQSHPGLPSDVWQAPQDQVLAIYKAKYWDALACNLLPYGVDYAVFDYGVNSGISRSAKLLQQLVGVPADGQIGPFTVKATATADALTLVNKLCDARLAFLKGLGTWGTFGRGWSTRVADVRRDALAMVHTSTAPAPESKPPLPPIIEPPKPVPASGAPELHDLGHRIKRTMLAKQYPWFDDQNVISVEGMDPNGTVNKNRPNAFDDFKCVLDGDGRIIGGPWEGTTQPGVYWTTHPMASGGAFIIALGPQACWTPGDYHGDAWRQAEDSTIMGHRDPNCTYQRQGPPVKHGYIGVHHHKGYDLPRDNIANAAAGCQVIRLNDDQIAFMNLTRKCSRYLKDPKGFRLTATVLQAKDILS